MPPFEKLSEEINRIKVIFKWDYMEIRGIMRFFVRAMRLLWSNYRLTYFRNPRNCGTKVLSFDNISIFCTILIIVSILRYTLHCSVQVTTIYSVI